MPPRRIAAVVVSYRAPTRAVAAVRALARSRRALDQVLVVDNGGADAARLGRELPAATVIATTRNLGFAGGANVGLRAALEAGADAVLLVNDDAALAPDALEALERALDAPGVGIVAPALVRPDERVESLGLSFAPWSGRLRELGRGAVWAPTAAGAPREVDAASACVLLVARAVLEAVGLFDEGYFFYFEDLDLCLRVRQAGWRVVVEPRAVAHHEGSATIGRRSARRLYLAVRGHLRLGARLGGPGALPRQAAIAAWNLAHAWRHRRGLDPGALRAVVRGVVDHVAGRPLRGPADDEPAVDGRPAADGPPT